MAKYTCIQCDKNFKRNGLPKKGKSYNFCGHKCYWNNMKKKKECICQTCGISFMPKSHVMFLKYCNKKCQPAWNKGKKAPWAKGKNNVNWAGGISTLQELIRGSVPYREWQRFVAIRDNYTCQICLKSCSGDMNIDHIKPVSTILRENKIYTIEQALSYEELWDTTNGRVLCIECHKKTDTYGIKLLLRNGGLD